MTQTAHSVVPPLDALVHWFEHLTPDTLTQLGQHYAPNSRFKDPFNDIQGHAAIQQVFAHMFASLHEPRFAVTGQVQQGQQAFLTWDFVFRFRRFDTTTLQTVRGATHLLLDEEGRVTLHRDYWDAAEELYEKLPVVGGLMRWLKRRANS
jgi:ketosteroid isomerase-like protein